MTSSAHGGSRSDRYLRVAGWAFLVAIAMRYGCNVASDPDIWWHLASGRLICDEGGFPEHDVFSYSETRASYVYHEWLSSVIFYLLHSRVSPVSVYLLKALLAAAVVLMMMRRQQRALSLPRILFWGLVLSVVGRGFGMRARIFSYALFALTLLLLDLSREHKRRNMIWLRPFSKSLVASVLVLFSLLRGAETVLGYIDVRGGGIAWTEELNESDFPAGAVSYMRERKLTGNLAVTFEYGAY